MHQTLSSTAKEADDALGPDVSSARKFDYPKGGNWEVEIFFQHGKSGIRGWDHEIYMVEFEPRQNGIEWGEHEDPFENGRPDRNRVIEGYGKVLPK